MAAKSIKGTKGADLLSGSSGDDVIYGLNGNDTIVAGGGNDLVDGGAGDDSIDGGLGNDSLFGGLGNDTINDHDGSNLVYGGTGDDNIDLSGSGANTIYGDGYDSFKLQSGSLVPTDLSTSPGADSIGGGSGNDTIYGDNGDNLGGTGAGGADVIHGNDGADVIYGEGGSDQLFGDAGNDQLVGGSGDDTLNGGTGNDVLTGGAGNDVIDGGVHTGPFPDTDTANYLVAGVTTGVNVNLSTHTATDGMGGTDTLQNIDRVVGTQFDDVLIGGDPANAGNNGMEIFEGRGGNDTITGAAGYNTWAEYRDAAGGVIVDLNLGQASNDGDGGVDTLVNVNRVRGSAFDDQIYGRDNPTGTNERFEGMAGNDLIDGRGGFDVVHYTSSPSAVTVDLLAGTASDGFGTTDTLVSIEGVRGSNFDDTLFGSNSSGLETFEGMAGNDNIDGQGGPDRIEYSRSPSGVMVDLGHGTASDGFGTTDHFVNIEAARGSLFNDTLIGSSRNDSLDGSDGNDTLIGGLGNDTLIGGNGDNTFIYALGDGADVINGGPGTNTLAVLGTTGDDTAHLMFSTSGPPQLFGLGPVSGIAVTTLDLGSGNDTLSYAGSTQDVSATLGGAGLGLSSIQNVEILIGGSGNDYLVGDQNDNVITGGPGNDALLGGPGNDTFNYTIGDGADQIDMVDAQQGAYDTIRITGTGGNDTLDFVWYGPADMYQSFNGTIAKVDAVTLDMGDGQADTLDYSGTVFNIAATLGGEASGFTGPILGVENTIGGNNDDILNGDDNANWITGGPGNDTLSGGSGDDQFFYTIGDGADSIDGGPGSDTLVITGTVGDDKLNVIWSDSGLTQVAGGPVTGIESGSLDLGAGNDTVSYEGSTANVQAYLGVTASGFPYTFTGVENITGGSGDDNLGGDENANVLIGGPGNDGLLGAGGNDLLQGGDGNDVLRGESGNDTLDGGAGNDLLLGDESTTGAAGDDFLIGGAGNDTLEGGLGADIFKWVLADRGTYDNPAVDTINDFGNGADKLDLAELLVGEHADATSLDNYLTFQYVGGSNSTVINIDSNGNGNGNMDQQIVLFQSGDLTAGANVSNTTIINNMLNAGQLIVDA